MTQLRLFQCYQKQNTSDGFHPLGKTIHHSLFPFMKSAHQLFFKLLSLHCIFNHCHSSTQYTSVIVGLLFFRFIQKIATAMLPIRQWQCAFTIMNDWMSNKVLDQDWKILLSSKIHFLSWTINQSTNKGFSLYKCQIIQFNGGRSTLCLHNQLSYLSHDTISCCSTRFFDTK